MYVFYVILYATFNYSMCNYSMFTGSLVTINRQSRIVSAGSFIYYSFDVDQAITANVFLEF